MKKFLSLLLSISLFISLLATPMSVCAYDWTRSGTLTHVHTGSEGPTPNGCYTLEQKYGGSCPGHNRVEWFCVDCGGGVAHNLGPCTTPSCVSYGQTNRNASRVTGTTTHTDASQCSSWQYNSTYVFDCSLSTIDYMLSREEVVEGNKYLIQFSESGFFASGLWEFYEEGSTVPAFSTTGASCTIGHSYESGTLKLKVTDVTGQVHEIPPIDVGNVKLVFKHNNVVEKIKKLFFNSEAVTSIVLNGELVWEAIPVNLEGVRTEFAYTGGVQTFTVPQTGLYKLEVWGGRPQTFSMYGFTTRYGGAGGYSVGYKELKKGTVLYVVCGGGNGATYNGGGAATNGDQRNGAGATHIALVGGTLAEIGYDEFVTNSKGLIVAGGGGSGSMYGSASGEGGAGGGLTGGSATHYGTQAGGTQTSGHAFGKGGAGAGGGLYGGYGANGVASGGGSGYIGGVLETVYKGITFSPVSKSGVNSGNGRAAITRVVPLYTSSDNEANFKAVADGIQDSLADYCIMPEVSFGEELAITVNHGYRQGSVISDAVDFTSCSTLKFSHVSTSEWTSQTQGVSVALVESLDTIKTPVLEKVLLVNSKNASGDIELDVSGISGNYCIVVTVYTCSVSPDVAVTTTRISNMYLE